MSILGSNESITKLAKKAGGNVWDFVSSGAKSSHAAYEAMAEDSRDIFKAIAEGHMKEGAEEAVFKNLDPAKVAGSYMLASGAYRVASGGGLYRDKDGNTNIIGVPFI